MLTRPQPYEAVTHEAKEPLRPRQGQDPRGRGQVPRGQSQVKEAEVLKAKRFVKVHL